MRGLILSIIAPFLFLLITPLNLGVILWKHAKARGFYKTIDKYLIDSAKNIDCFGNANFKPLFDAWLIKSNGYPFGKLDETISSALGKNQKTKTLTICGWIIVLLLWIIDIPYWFKGGHCINAIE